MSSATDRHPIVHLAARAGALALGLCCGAAVAQFETLSTTQMADYTRQPLTSVEQATPMVMLTMTRDHQLYYRAYNDYSDLDGDGIIETTYKHSIDYYGYFDSRKCYDYDNSDARFEPKAVSNNKYCDGVAGAWSGNFLNWASMSRMDAVRRLLFGGMRETDTASSTVLERAYIPMDGHAFTKYYNGADFARLTPMDNSDVTLSDSDPKKNGFTMCSMTWAPDNEFSDTTTRPPILRIAEGNYTLWNTSERHICNWRDDPGSSNGDNGNREAISGISAFSDSPRRADDAIEVQGGDGDYVVRVEACVSGLVGEEPCKQYPDGTRKPIGLLQRYGDDNLIHFGLLTGSYEKNISGGVLRKNVRSFNDEVAVDTNGVFTSTGAGSIVDTLNALRMYGYEYDDRFYNNRDNCGFQLATIKEGDCATWGNPLSEMYLEGLRYFAGANETPGFLADDSGYLADLVREAWTDPLDESNYCSALSTVVFNASVNDYDDDQMGGISDLGTTSSAAALTDIVAKAEGLLGKRYFVGRNGTDNNELCSAKTVNSLGAVAGICPEAPTKLGSYLMVGAAHYAATNDIRPNYPASGTGVGSSQTVKTYGVALSPAVPKVSIPVPGSKQVVTLLPAYRNLKDPNQPGAGSLVEFRVVQPHSESGGKGTGKFFVSWEDSEQGGDHDQDVWGLIEYTITGSEIRVTTETVAESTSTEQLFGYVISGTETDGFHAHSGIEGVDFTDPTGVLGCTDCRPSASGAGAGSGQSGPTSVTYKLGGSSASLLQAPLFYAAKYGGFNETDDVGDTGFGFPDKQVEWDQLDVNGAPAPDGIPDTYFQVDNPARLEAALQAVFDKIIASTASGTAAAVVANAREGEGAVYQALFEPSRTDNNGQEVRWIGTVHSLWIDSDGNLREDDGDAVLEGFGNDPAVELFFDEKQRRVRFRRYKADPATATPTLHEIDELATLWNARKQLSAVSDVINQRVYNTPASSGRYITTFLDYDLDGVVDNGEQLDFVPGTFTNDNHRILNFLRNEANGGVAAARLLVNYLRGADINSPLARSRTLDYDNDGTNETMRLGDIVNSTPTVAAAPSEAFDLLYDDETYEIFRRQYAQRRNMIYVGANDGMLHAFNGGCFDPSGPAFKTTGGGCKTDHPLGSEIWAYVPFNLLPHLRWLADPNYTHVPYVDGKPRIFDARIFTPDSDHPGGWGTVLAVGFRFGGGEITLDRRRITDFGRPNSITLRSGYALLDVTNPEVPPKVIAEITHPELNFATSFPSVIAVSKRGNNTGNVGTEGWYLVFGSGPTELLTGTSTDSAKLFVYDLQSKSFVSGYGPFDLGESNAMTGDPVTVDWNLDFKADAVYFGTVSGTEANPSGSLRKLGINAEPTVTGWTDPVVMLKTDEPVAATPAVTIDNQQNRYVFGGTGRFLGPADKISTDRQLLYGVRDDDKLITDGTETDPRRTVGDLFDVTDARVSSNGVVDGIADVTDYGTLRTKVQQAGGWRLNLATGASAERAVTQLSVLGEIVFATPFTPSADLCGGEGSSRLFGVDFRTGTASPDIQVFGTQDATFGGQQVLEAVRSVDLGAGLGASPSLHFGSGRDSRGLTVLTQTSTGAIERRQGQVAGGARSGEISWQEPYLCQ